MSKEYEVWTEGYSATGEHSGAICHTVKDADYMHGKMGTPIKVIADSFEDACKKVLGDSLDKNEDGSLRLDSDGRPMVWACRCFDNEVDARKSFG